MQNLPKKGIIKEYANKKGFVVMLQGFWVIDSLK